MKHRQDIAWFTFGNMFKVQVWELLYIQEFMFSDSGFWEF
jgi:hypothetical protein